MIGVTIERTCNSCGLPHAEADEYVCARCKRRARQIVLREGTYLTGAARFACELPIGECSHSTVGALWLATGFGALPVAIVVASTWGRAWEEMLDTLPPIAPEDEPEAYGFDGADDPGWQGLMQAVEAPGGYSNAEWPELAEGYAYQSNASGTGIVRTDAVRLEPLTRAWLDRLHIELAIERG